VTGAHAHDVETRLSKLEAEFRRACEAQRDFLAWYGGRFEVPFDESLHRYSEMVEASGPWAASYRRFKTEFPAHTERLHTVLLPIQQDIFGNSDAPGVEQARATKGTKAKKQTKQRRWWKIKRRLRAPNRLPENA
jgi:hypothetical protein